MAADFEGIGYSFQGKDDGLTKLQERISKGFEAIEKNMESMSAQSQRVADSLDKSMERNEQAANTFENAVSALEKTFLMGVKEMTSASRVLSKQMGDFAKKSETDLGNVQHSFEGVGDAAKDNLDEKVKKSAKSGGDAVKKTGAEISNQTEMMAEGFGKVGEAVGLLKKILVNSKLQTLIQGIGLNAFDSLKGGLRGATQLTASLEGRIVATDKSARAMGANMGYTGKDLAKFSGRVFSLSDGLNVSEEAAGKAIRAFDEMDKKVLESLNLNEKSLAKLQEVGLVDADLLRDTTLRMTKSLGMGADSIDRQLDSWIAYGQSVGDVNSGFEMFQKQTEYLEKMKSLGATAEQMEEFSRSSAALGTGLFQFAQTGEEAASTVGEIQNILVGTRQEFSNMFAGLQKDAPDNFKKLAVLAQNSGVAIEALGKSPDQFLLGMSKIISAKGGWDNFMNEAPEQANFLQARLTDMFGGSAPAVLSFLRNVDSDTMKMMESTRTATRDLEELGNEAYRSGRTLEDRMNRATEKLVHNFRAISRSEARQFVSDTEKEYSKFAKTLDGVVQEGGPMATFVKRLSAAHQLGAMAFIPETLRPMAQLFGDAAQAMLPAVAGLNAFGIQVGKLLNPVTLLAAGLGGVVFALKATEKDYVSSIEKMADSSKALGQSRKDLSDMENRLGGLVAGTAEYDKLQGQIQKKKYAVDQAEALSKEEKALAGLQKQLSRTAEGSSVYADLQQKIAAQEDALAGRRKQIQMQASADSKASLEAMVESTTKKVVTFAQALPDIISAVADTLAGGGGGLVRDVGEALFAVVGAAFRGLVAVAPQLGGLLKDGFLAAVDFFSNVNTDAVAGVFNSISDVMTSAFTRLKEVDWGNVLDGISNFLKGLIYGGGDESSSAARVGAAIGDVFKSAIGIAADIAGAAAGALFDAIFIEPWRGYADNVAEAWEKGVFEGISAAFSGAADALLGNLAGVGATLLGAMLLSSKVRGVILKGVGGILRGTVGKVLGGLLGPIKKSFGGLMGWLTNSSKQACDQLSTCGAGMGGGMGAGGATAAAGKKKGRRRLSGGKLLAGAGGAALAGGYMASEMGLIEAGGLADTALQYGGLATMAAPVLAPAAKYAAMGGSAALRGGRALVNAPMALASKGAGAGSLLAKSAGSLAKAAGPLTGAAFAIYNVADQWDKTQGAASKTALVAQETGLAALSTATLGLSELTGLNDTIRDTIGPASNALAETAAEWTGEAEDRRKRMEDNAKRGMELQKSGLVQSMAVRQTAAMGGYQAEGLAGGVNAKAIEEQANAMTSLASLTEQIASIGEPTSDIQQQRLDMLMQEKLTLLEQMKVRGNLTDQQLGNLYHLKDAAEVDKARNTFLIKYVSDLQKSQGVQSNLTAMSKDLGSYWDATGEAAGIFEARAMEALGVIGEMSAEAEKFNRQIDQGAQAQMQHASRYEALQKTLESGTSKQRERARQELIDLRKQMLATAGDVEKKIAVGLESGALTEDQAASMRVQSQNTLTQYGLTGGGADVSNLFQGNASKNIAKQIDMVRRMGAKAVNEGMVLDQNEVLAAMDLATKSEKKKLRVLLDMVKAADIDAQNRLQASVANLQNELALGGFVLGDAATTMLAGAGGDVVSSMGAAFSRGEGAELGSGTAGTLDIGGARDRAAMFGWADQWKADKAAFEEKMQLRFGIAPISVNDYLNAYAEATTDEARAELQKRLALTKVLDPQMALQGQQNLMDVVYADLQQQIAEAPTDEIKAQYEQKLAEMQLKSIGQSFMRGFMGDLLSGPAEGGGTASAEGAGMGGGEGDTQAWFEGQVSQLEAAAEKQKGTVSQIYTDTESNAIAALDVIKGRVEEDYGNSLSTDYIIPDFQRSQGAVEEFAIFAEDRIRTMTQNIAATMSDMWTNILDDTAQAVSPLLEDINTVYAELAAVRNVVSTQTAVTTSTVKAELPKLTAEDRAAASQMSLIEAVHMPIWYSKHYSPQFKALMGLITDLITVTRASGGVTGRGGASAAAAGSRRSNPPQPGASVRSNGRTSRQ